MSREFPSSIKSSNGTPSPPKTFRIVVDDAQIRLHETAERVFIAVLLKLLAELTLVIRRQRWET